VRRRIAALLLWLLAVCAAAAQTATLGYAEKTLVQERLIALGHLAGDADGQFGPMTRSAIENYQTEQGNPISGDLTLTEVESLLAPLPVEHFDLLDNLDLPGGDYRDGLSDPSLKNIDLGTCQASCVAEQNCKAFTYNTSARVCFLKRSVPARVAFQGAISGTRREASVAMSLAAVSLAFERLDNQDLPQNDYRSGLGDASLKGIDFGVCESQCAADAACQAYTYNSAARVCFLKSTAAEPVPFSGAISGIKTKATPTLPALWVTDPDLLVTWARGVVDDYAPAPTPLELPDAEELLNDPKVLALRGEQFDLTPLEGVAQARLMPEGSWSLLARRGGDIISMHTDALTLSPDYNRWIADNKTWRSSYDDASTAVVATWAPRLEAMVEDLEDRYGAGNPLAGYVKLDLVTALGVQSQLVRANNQDPAPLSARMDVLLHDAVANLVRPYTGSEGLASILRTRGVAALLRQAKPPENCENTPDQTSSTLYQQAAALLHQSGGAEPWVIDAMHGAAVCALPEDKPELFAAAADLASSDTVMQARNLMDMGIALAAIGDDDGARAAFRTGMSLNNGRAYARAFPWMRVWFSEELLLQRLGLNTELDVVLAHRFIQALGNGTEESTSSFSGYFGMGHLLERLKRFELADMLYAAVAPAWQSGPELPATLIAAEAINDRDYQHANNMLERMLSLTPIGSNDGLRVKLLSMLAQSYQLAGEFGQSGDYAEQALILLGSGTVQRTQDTVDVIAALEEHVRVARTDSGDEGRQASKDVEQFAELVNGACVTGHPLPELPAEFLDGTLARSIFVREVAESYAECAHRQFSKRFVTDIGWTEEVEVERYFRTLFAAGAEAYAAEDFNELISVEPQRQGNEGDIGWGVRRKLSRLNAAIKAAIVEGSSTVADDMLEKMLVLFDGGLLEQMIDLDMLHEDVPQTVLLLRAAGKDEDFLRLAVRIDEARAATQLGYSCYGAICKVAIELRNLQGDAEGVAEFAGRLENGMHIYWGGASTDSKDLDGIMAMAESEAMDAMRLHLPSTAFAYFSIAGADSERILADPFPLSSLKKVSVAGSYATALLETGQHKQAYEVSHHLLIAARARVESATLFADDALLAWSRRLRPALDVFLGTAPTGHNGAYDQAIAEDVLFAVQFLQATGTSATVGQLAARGASAEPDSAYRRYLDLSRQIEQQLAMFSQDGAAANLDRKIAALREQQQSAADELAIDDPEFFRFGRLQFASSATIVDALKQKEAISTTYAGPFGLVRIWLDRSGLIADRADIAADELSKEVAEFRQSIVGDGSSAVRTDLAYKLFETLFGGRDDRFDLIEHLVFVPSGVLDGLPLPALMTSAPVQPELEGDGPLPWLIRRVDVAVLPSLSGVLVMRSDVHPSSAPYPFLGIGNPAYGFVDPVHGPLTPLRETEAEVRFMGALLQANSSRDLLLGSEASKENLSIFPLDQYRLVAFATHGFLAQGLTGANEPGLALSGLTLDETLLTSSDIAALRFDADLVILSACSTAGSDGTPGAEGLSGLASAFFYAGSRGLMVTHWDIPSGPALDMTTGMISAHEADASIGWPAALRRSVLAMLDKPRTPLHAHPVSWAGHFLVTAQ
jgi:CHAT domain-containing protein